MLCAINLYNIAVALSGGCHFHLNTVTSYLGFPEFEQCATLPSFVQYYSESYSVVCHMACTQ